MKRATIERILCPVDFSAFSVRACDYASSLARHFGAKLFVQHVVEIWQYPSASFAATANDYDKFCASLVVEGKEQLQNFVKSHAENGVDPECVTSDGMAVDCILAFAEKQAIDLIVMGTHGTRGFERLMLGSVTEKVLRRARCPVLAVPEPSHDLPAPAPGEHPFELRRIIFCTDFSDSSNSALDYAISVADQCNAELTVLHVMEDIFNSPGAEDTLNAYERLDALIPARAKTASTIKTAVRVGRAYREISQLARESGADLVIMTVHGRNALDDAVFGSTTYRVIQLGSCPVLTVHPSTAAS
jgi:nucleotide-binding universal stress UspA family protein